MADLDLPDIPKVVDEMRLARRQVFPRHTNYMSDAGHPCERYLVYTRTNWADRVQPDAKLLGIFEDGDIHEKAVLRTLQDAGFDVTDQQIKFFDKESELSGRCDCRVTDKSTAISFLVDIKSMSPFIWVKVDTYEDLVNSHFPWLRHYPAQMQLYLHFDGTKFGAFLLKNKATGELKTIWVRYDQDLALSLIEKGKRVTEAVKSGSVPDRISTTLGLCEDCQFRLVCLPDLDFGEGAEVSYDPELGSMLARRSEVEGYAKEFERLDGLVKKAVRGRTVICGEYLCESSLVHKKSYEVKASDSWRVSIRKRALAPPSLSDLES